MSVEACSHERWTSGSDKRRIGGGEVIDEMDGMGVQERGDWPMRDVSPEKEEGRGKRRNSGGVGVGEEDGWVVERDVSEVDEEEVRDVGSVDVDEACSVVPPVIEGEGGGLRPAMGKGEDGIGARGEGGGYGGQSRPSVSPEREEVMGGGPVSEPDLDDMQCVADEVEQEDDGMAGTQSRNEDARDTQGQDNGYDSSEERDKITPTAMRRQPVDVWNSQSPQSPIRSPPASPGPSMQMSPRSHSRQSSSINGQTTPTSIHGRQNSMLKQTPPGTSSRRSSVFNPYNTTQINHNNNRVRYSWQSVQDDQPNRPRIHIIKLVSNTATASSGFPHGEAFGFSMSPSGRRIAAYNSARLYVLQTAALPVGISQDYALKRRPLAVEIVDDGNVLAILADQHTVNIYDLSHQRLRRAKTIKLDFPTHCIALGPMGGLLAAAYEGGVEIFALDASALPTDRRAVRSHRMDRLSFSDDGSTLVGTTTRVNVSSTVVVNVPVFPSSPDGVPNSAELKEAWCHELLHPENIRNSSHAVFMREDRTTCNERLFAWNGLEDTFGILDTPDMHYGHVDFPIVITPPLSTCGGLGAAIHSCPAIDEHGDTVAMIVNDRTIRLYIVPPHTEEAEHTVEAHSIDHELDEGYGCPFSDARWVYAGSNLPTSAHGQTNVKGRLIVTSPGGVIESGLPEELVQDVEGGRIIMFDFDPQFAGQPGQTFSLTLGKSPAQTLEEAEFDVADEVALVRRRTVNQSKSGGLSQRPITLGRAATTFGSGRNALQQRRVGSPMSMQSEATRSLPDLLETSEGVDGHVEPCEEPFSNTAPRSQASLQRAATNAQRHRYQTLEERNQERVSVDSNGHFLPLPEYTEEPNAPLPSRFRAMAGLDAPMQAPSRPSIVTSHNGGMSARTNTAPMTAPASIADNFSAEQAFAVANASSQDQNAPPPMPRSLQRAYSNAVRPTPPSLIGDWENVSPRSPSRSETTSPHPPTSRHSTSQPPPTQYNNDQSQPTHYSDASTRRLPPHMQALRATQQQQQQQQQNLLSSHQLPNPSYPTAAIPYASASAYTHPITAWHPPASNPISPNSPHFPRKASTSTPRAKKSGFFRRKEKRRAERVGMWEDRGEWRGEEDGGSVRTWVTGRVGRTGEGGGRGCVVM